MHGQQLSVFCASSVPSAATGADHSAVIQRSFSDHSAMFLRPRRLLSVQNRSLSDLECQGAYMPGSDAFSISLTTAAIPSLEDCMRMSNQLLLHAAILQGQHALLVNQTAIAITRRRAETDRQRRKRPRTWWVRPWLTHPRRLQSGDYNQLLQELRLEDEGSFYDYLRMEPAMFDELLQRIGPRITKQDTNWRNSLEPGLKLSVTLRYLATGDKYPTLQPDQTSSSSVSRAAS